MRDEVRHSLRRDRGVLGAALAGIAVVAAWGTLSGVGMSMSALEMTRMGGTPGLGGLGLGDAMAAMPRQSWTPGHAAAMLAMWWIMMLAMMLPSAMPMVQQYAVFGRLGQRPHAAPAAPYVLAGGYGLAWGAFSLAAVLLQWRLDEARLLSPMLLTGTRWLAAALLIGAGVWQLSPLKGRCLALCRSPTAFLVRHWRQGPLRMGLTHGFYCLGCCWALMLLLFYGGVMNLWWIVGLSVLVLVEKLTPVGPWLAQLVGVGLIVWGAALAFAVV